MRSTPTANMQQFIKDLTPAKIRLGVMVALTSLVVLLFAAFLIYAINWQNTPFLGATLNHTMTVNSAVSNSGESWEGIEAGLQSGDQILRIGDQAIGNLPNDLIATENYEDVLNQYEVGDTVTLAFRYDPERHPGARAETVTCGEINSDGYRECTVDVTLSNLPDADFVAFFIVPYMSGVIVLIATIALLYLRPLDTDTFTAVLTLLALALSMAGIFNVGSSHELAVVWISASIMLGMMMFTLGMVFPTTLPPVARHPFYRFVPFIFGIILMTYASVSYQNNNPEPLPVVNQIATVSAILGLAILAAFTGFYHRVHAFLRTQRDQANIIFMGALLGIAPATIWIAGRFLPGDSIIALSVESTMPFLIVPAISLVYAVLQYRLFNTENTLSQGITYTLLLAALGIGYTLLVLGATLFATETIDARNPILIVVTIFTVSVLFVPVRTNLQRQIDKIYFRTRRDYQGQLETFSQKLTSLAGANIMIEEFRNLLDETVEPINTLIFLRNYQTGEYIAYGKITPETDITFNDNSGVIRLLRNSDTTIYLQPGQPWPHELQQDKTRLGIIRVMVIAGMPGENQLNGFVAVGPPRSPAGIYRYEELRFINNLVGQLSIAVERATVVESLERSVRELGVLSAVSQAVNFTVETSDLMELLSAQTMRIIQASYFYIVLYDIALEKLYYAFFMENDVRNETIENRRWDIGKDLYSEVIANDQPQRVDDYASAMARNGYNITYESSNTKAWMAVPLSAGGRVLGLMAVGDPDPEMRFSNEQMRVFSDIGALAASSLDKARLFSEANARARQLAVLNDISRQLVATEGDIERLLDLITNSAVDILNAEAGSLLLTAEDNSGDLEFRVAVGGTGQDLVGKRLEKGFGLVGRVAESGRPVISNDTSSDQDWEGEVTEDRTFQTRSVLAVPLIAQDSVIGVLEVINKRDGSIYVEQDVELLTTFAGQAAIAFENARLFQQTDLQLSQRVRELEVLERVDRELNQNLDLYNVAEITVRWAMENSNATAGLLGIPDEDMAYMTVVAKRGYGDEDVPEGAAGNRWPITNGIIKRVMRSRRPDLQPYVAMDPDYIPSLQNALSQITVPMIAGEEIGAILILETNIEPRLTLLDQDWAQRLAEHASIAIENAKLYEELTRANETKSEFMGFVAHEIKNPLTSVKGYASTLASSMILSLPPEQIQQFAKTIANNADKIQNVVDDLRDIARSDADQLNISLEPTDFRQVVIDTLLTLQNRIDEKHQTVVKDYSEDLPLVLGDNRRLYQIMVNFISNAHKYSPEEATITISAKPIKQHRSRYSNNKIFENMMHIRVIDTGYGMSEDDLNRLFREDYFRSESEVAKKEEGTGLGMIVTKRLIEGHQGEVWVESVLGEGSTFHFVIPIAPETDPVNAEEETTEQPEASD